MFFEEIAGSSSESFGASTCSVDRGFGVSMTFTLSSSIGGSMSAPGFGVSTTAEASEISVDSMGVLVS